MNHECLAKEVGAGKNGGQKIEVPPIIVWQIPHSTTKSQFTGQ